MRGAIIAGAMLFIASGWPTQSHDTRRMGQSDVLGPRAPERVDSFLLTGEQSVNMPIDER